MDTQINLIAAHIRLQQWTQQILKDFLLKNIRQVAFAERRFIKMIFDIGSKKIWIIGPCFLQNEYFNKKYDEIDTWKYSEVLKLSALCESKVYRNDVISNITAIIAVLITSISSGLNILGSLNVAFLAHATVEELKSYNIKAWMDNIIIIIGVASIPIFCILI